MTDHEELPDHIKVQIEEWKARKETMRSMGFDLEKKYYLAGPMSGYENYNYPAFADTAAMLRGSGLQIESPHELPWPDGHETMPLEKLWADMMKKSGKMMRGCDGIILMQGWPASKGARKELSTALVAGWPVWFISETGMIVNMNKIEKEESDEADPVGE